MKRVNLAVARRESMLTLVLQARMPDFVPRL